MTWASREAIAPPLLKATSDDVLQRFLESGHKATILTDSANVAMLKTAESVGFYRSSERGKAKREAL